MCWAEHAHVAGWPSPCPCMSPFCAARAPLRPWEVAGHMVAESCQCGPSGPSHSWPDRPALPGWTTRSITGPRSVRGRRSRNLAPIHAAAACCSNPRLPGVVAVPVGRTQPWERRGQSWVAAWRGPWGRGGGHPAAGGGGNGAPSVRPARAGDAAPQLLPARGHSEQGPDGAHT